MIREEELKQARLHGVRRATAKESNNSGTGERDLEQFENDENRSNANGSPTVITDKSREQESNGNSLLGQKQQTATKRGNSNNIVHDAIAKLIYNDLVRNAYLHGSSQRSSSSTHQHPHPSLRSLNSSSDGGH